MKDIRNHIESFFKSFGHTVYRHRLKTVVIMFLLTIGLCWQLPEIAIDTSTEGFLREDDPALQTYNAFREQFGRDEMIIIAVQPPEVFDKEFLMKLKSFHEDLEEEVPHIDDIISMVNARVTRGEGDRLIVGDLLDDWPEDEEDLLKLKERVMSNPLYQNTLISKDVRVTTVVIKTDSYSSIGLETDVLAGFEEEPVLTEGGKTDTRGFLTDAENSAVVRAVYSVMARYDAPDFRLHLAGSPVVSDVLKRTMMKDMRRFIILVVLTIGLFLYLLFRRISGVVLPLLIVILSLLSTLGLMAMCNRPIKLPTTILPSFLLAVGVGASVHILAIFFQQLRRGNNKEEAIVFALGHSGLAVVMTSLTTAAGLMSFATAEIAPIADLGKFAGAGVLFSLTYTIVLLPALLALVPLKVQEAVPEEQSPSLMDRTLSWIADVSTGHPKSILTVSILLNFFALVVAFQIRFSHNPLLWLPEEMDVRQATSLIDREMEGTISVEVIADTGVENGLYDPEILNELDELSRSIERIEEDGISVGKTISVVDVLKEIHKALNENRHEFYVVPQDRRLIAQEFLLFENSGSDDLEDFVDSRFTRARLTVKVPWLDAIVYKDFLDMLLNRCREILSDQAEITITGMLALLGRTVYAAMVSAAKSYLIAGFVITLMMVMLIGNFRIGLVSMVPNLIPIILTLGIMGIAGMPMDMFTMLIGSIAIGLAVDDTIHFMHNFRRYYYESNDARLSVHKTFHTTGRAMLITSVVLSIGFFIYMFASMNNLFNFGLLTGVTIVTALLADFFLAPALMVLITGKGGRLEKSKSSEWSKGVPINAEEKT